MKLLGRHVLVFVAIACAGCSDNSVGTPGAPTAVSISAGNSQAGAAGAQLSSPIAAKVTDAGGHGVPNQRVDFFVTAGLGRFANRQSLPTISALPQPGGLSECG